jgi:hypothetical protein
MKLADTDYVHRQIPATDVVAGKSRPVRRIHINIVKRSGGLKLQHPASFQEKQGSEEFFRRSE